MSKAQNKKPRPLGGHGPVRIVETGSRIVGCAIARTPSGPIPVLAAIQAEKLEKKIAKQLMDAYLRQNNIDKDQVGWGFLKKAWRRIKRTAKKVARSVGRIKVVKAIGKGLKSVVRVAKKIVNNPVVAAGIGVVATVVPGVGPAIGAGYAAVRAAVNVVDGVANKDPRAIRKVAQYALGRTHADRKAMALLQSVQPVRKFNTNPWLTGAAKALGLTPAQLAF